MNRGQGGRWPYRNRGRQRGSWRLKNRGRGHDGSQSTGQINHLPNRCVDDVPSSSDSSYNILSHCNETEAKVVDFSPHSGPYAGWKLYITDESYEANSESARKLKIAERYCKKLQVELGTESIESKGSFNIELKDLIATEHIICNWKNFLEDLRDSSEKVINYFGLAMHQMITEEICEELAVNVSFPNEGNNKTEPVQCNIPKIHARFVGFEPLTPLKHIKAVTFGKFVSIKGTVVRVSNIKPLCTEMAFSCKTCGKIQVITQPDGKYSLPEKCTTKGCRSHQFSPLCESELTKTVDWQDIRLQEIVLDDNRDSGRVPRTIECKLMYDLVDCCIPGDIITISGIVKVISSQDYFKSNKGKSMYLLYILGNSIVNCRENNITKNITMSLVGMELNAKDMCAIETIQNEPNLFRLLTASLCPSIFGHEMVKAGLILGLVGGTRKFVDDENRIPIRGDPHILVVGDPGLGKSQMLQACANVVPRGVYVCGNTTTTSGLTVTLTKEGTHGEYALEAGALVLADQGCCCIDEFDKMSNQHHALLEAMEQQTISIAKGGMVCSLPARTSILAAANPVGGHYNKAKTVSENLRMGSALLSRFDLVFILLDKPNQELDCKLSEHVIALHSGKGGSNFCRPSEFCGTPVSSLGCHSLDNECPLSTRLKFQHGELDLCDPIPHQLLRKYIAFASEKSKPKLTPEAAQVLQQFYLDLRKNHQTSDCTPITTRQLESMIRLTEARARIELRESCTRQDALDVVELTKYSMIDTYSDQFGLLHFQRSQHGSGMSSRSKAKKFIAGLTAVSQKTCSSAFTVQQMKQICNEIKLDILDFESFLLSLNTQGFLLKKGPKLYELQTTDF